MKNIIFCAAIIFIASCTGNHNKKGVELAMNQYDRLIQKMDADSISLLYAPEGDLGDVAHGRDSIRRFLSSFKNFKVLVQSSVTNLLQVKGDSAFQKGTYRQVVVTPANDTFRLKGEYTANWIWLSSGWHIRRMSTKPSAN